MSKRLLIVDDEEFVRSSVKRLVRRMLHGQTADIHEAGDGTEALEIIERHTGDTWFVLSDLDMRGMDGFGLLRALHDKCPHVRRTFVLHTASIISEHTALAVGADGLLQKTPDEIDAYRAKLEEYILGFFRE